MQVSQFDNLCLRQCCNIADIAGIADSAVMSVDFVGLPSMFYPFVFFVRDHIAGIADIADIAVMSVALILNLHPLCHTFIIFTIFARDHDAV